MSTLPTCRTAEDVKRLDGQQVRLVGTYRKKMDVRKMPRPGEKPVEHFFGYVQIEVEGSPTAWRPSAWDGAKALVSLGDDPRADHEVASFEGRRVAVIGRIVVDPTRLNPGDAPAGPAPDPQLIDPATVELFEE